MNGDPQVLQLLNEILTAELTAINQYFVHAKMCGNWGYERLRKDKWDASIDDMKDADVLIDRILLLNGVPNMQRYNPVTVGEDVAEMHRLDLAMEQGAVERLNRGIAACRDAGDNGTRVLLESILAGEEAAVDHLEAQLELIEQVGLQNYLATQILDE